MTIEMNLGMRVRTVERAHIDGVRSDGTEFTVPEPELSDPSGEVASPEEVRRTLGALQDRFVVAIASGDPRVLMALVATELRRTQTEVGESSLAAASAEREERLRQQLDAYRRAEEAQRGAEFWSTVARIGTYVACGAAIAAGIAGAVVSGGVSTVGAIALAATILSCGGTIALTAAKDLRLMGQEDPKWLTIALGVVALVGACCTLGATAGNVVALVGGITGAVAQAGNVSLDVAETLGAQIPTEARIALAIVGLGGTAVAIGAGVASAARSTGQVSNQVSNASRSARTAAQASQVTSHTITQTANRTANQAAMAARSSERTTQSVARIVETGARGVESVGRVTQGTGGILRAGYTHSADMERLRGREQQHRIEALRVREQDIVDALRTAMEAYDRMIRRAAAVGQQIDRTREQSVRGLARA